MHQLSIFQILRSGFAWASLSGNIKYGFVFVVLAIHQITVAQTINSVDVVTSDAFRQQIEPLLDEHCQACHGNGAKKGGVSFDGIQPGTNMPSPQFWWTVLRNVRNGIMPPPGKPRLTASEVRLIEGWIKIAALGLDSKNPDPGRVTVRRLNRVEYRNTIRDLMGVDFDTTGEFPPDDSGHGFDNIGEVLTMSPLLLEKYFDAAQSIIAQAVPTRPREVGELTIPGRAFSEGGENRAKTAELGPLVLSYYEQAKVTNVQKVEITGKYRVILDVTANERFVNGVFDYNRCRLIFRVDGQELYRQDLTRQDGRTYRQEFDRDWAAGAHELTVELEPLTRGKDKTRSLSLRLNGVTIRGPFAREHWVTPPHYARFFPGITPSDPVQRRRYSRELLARFATRAFRRPVGEVTLDRLVNLAEKEAAREGCTFESGIAQAMVAILASPRFLFREEGVDFGQDDHRFPLVDEHALASRLSYFLWSTMPDEELSRLASRHELRAQLPSQLKRMLDDPRSGELNRHFVGQWLQTRDIESVVINAFAVVSRDQPVDPEADRRRNRFRELSRKDPRELTDAEQKELKDVRSSFQRRFRSLRQFELNRDLRMAMRRETELLFGTIIKEDRSLLELIDSDYTFLNEPLAKHYGIDGVKGDRFRKVILPEGSVRGGVLTQGSVLAVTSNPDRTSPVKRGLFILDNILGTPPPPPPPDIPPLEADSARSTRKGMTLREALAQHRKLPSCSGCHDRMDPLGLAFENFNALGRWRDSERGQTLDSSGKLVTGESFSGARELKKILVSRYRQAFFRCLSEKMFTYALGRGLDYHDIPAIDEVVDAIDRQDGKAMALVKGIVNSAPFQRSRRSGISSTTGLSLGGVDQVPEDPRTRMRP